MSEKKTTIVVRLHANHPSGQRYRAGFKFGLNPIEVEVTDAELKMIQEDSFLKIVTAGTALAQATKASKHVAKEVSTSESDAKTIDDFTKKEIIAKLEEIGVSFTGRETKEVLRSMMNGKQETSDVMNLESLTVEEIVAKLEEKGLKEGTDFNASAERESLIQLLLA